VRKILLARGRDAQQWAVHDNRPLRRTHSARSGQSKGQERRGFTKTKLQVRGVHSVFTAQKYQKWLKTGVVARPKQIDLLHPKEMVKKRPHTYINLPILISH
jgi:hypothetical protein